MFHADISHYLETMGNPHGRFRTFSPVEPCRDSRGNPVFIAGSNSVTFKIHSRGGIRALKCYMGKSDRLGEFYKEVTGYLNAPGDKRLVWHEFLEEEIFIFDHHGEGHYLPVLVSEWVEGVSLRRWLTEKCRNKERRALLFMAGQFKQLALWLLDRDWAHGDLKPDNILVTCGGQLRLVDYDSVFIPSFAGKLSPELGTPGLQHPLRDPGFYNRHVDDYSITLICTALYALADHPEWYTAQADDEKLGYDPAGCVEGTCPLLQQTKEGWLESGKTELYRLATLLGSPSPEIPLLNQVLKRIHATSLLPSQELSGQPTGEIYRENGCYGFRSSGGDRQTAPIYDDAHPFCEGLAAVRIGKKKFYIAADGSKRIDGSGYDAIESFSEGLAGVCTNRKWGYIDGTGNVRIPPRFDRCRPFREGLAAVEIKGAWGYIDPDGNQVIPRAFDNAFDFRDGAAVVERNGRFGYIDREGKWLAEPRYSFATGFRNKRARAEENGLPVILLRDSPDKPLLPPEHPRKKTQK